MSAEHRDTNTQNKKKQKYKQKTAVIAQIFQIRHKAFKQDNNTIDHGNCDQRRYGPINYSPRIERAGDKAAGSSNHLHGLDEEAVAEHREPDGIIDEEYYSDEQQDRDAA